MHFDTDERALRAGANVAHPLVSAVLFLDPGDGAGGAGEAASGASGATVVVDQRLGEGAAGRASH